MSKNCVWYILTCYLYATSLLQPQKRDLRVLWDFKCFCRSFIIMWGERTHHKHWHQGHGPSGSSKDKKHDKRQPKFIPDNYSSVDEVRISKISWCDIYIYIWSPKKNVSLLWAVTSPVILLFFLQKICVEHKLFFQKQKKVHYLRKKLNPEKVELRPSSWSSFFSPKSFGNLQLSLGIVNVSNDNLASFSVQVLDHNIYVFHFL